MQIARRFGWCLLALLAIYWVCTYSALYFEQSWTEIWLVHAGLGAVALALALLWPRLERRLDLGYLTQLAVRFCLAYMMLFYGSAKLFPGGQFADPPLVEMDKPYYLLSPFWRAWGFYAHSAAYNAFLAASELAAGVLILFERTKRLAVCLLVGVMANVAIVNYAFKINVLYIALLLLAMSLALLSTELRWLRASFWTHEPLVQEPPRAPRVLRWAQVATVVLFVAQSAYLLNAYPLPKRGELYGIWRVEQSTAVPLFPRDARLYVDEDDQSHVRNGTALRPLELALDPARRNIKLRAKDGGVFAGSYRIAKDRVTLVAAGGARVELQRVY